MSPSFTLEQFLEMMARYNHAFWPMQVIAYILGITAIVCAIRSGRTASKIITGIVALMWTWVGVAFGFFYMRELSPQATIYTIIFVLQGIVFITAGISGRSLRFRFIPDVYGLIGGAIILYAMIGYPVIATLLGRGYPEWLPFGMVPCPTTVFTLGLLLWSEGRLPKYVLAIPFLYSLTVYVPISSGLVEDVGLLAAGLVTVVLIVVRDRGRRAAAEAGVLLR
jgi:hypothetical protein